MLEGTKLKTIKTDFLIIGAGIVGLAVAKVTLF
jgi:cation diffusion facilitator CzcD-associated flavoprotein CzcO